MCADAKPRRGKLPEILVALADVVDTTAAFTVKMMMVAHVGPFVADRLAGDFDRFYETVLQEAIDGTVDGSYADAIDLLSRGLKELLYAERPVRAGDDVAEGVSLTSPAGALGFHARTFCNPDTPHLGP